MRRAAAQLVGRVLTPWAAGSSSAAAVAVAAVAAQQMIPATLLGMLPQLMNTTAGVPVATGWRQQGFSTNSHDLFNTHRDTPDNNAETVFEWTPDNLKRAQAIIANYPPNYKASAIIPCLDLAQQQNDGWLSLAAMNSVAKLLEMPEIRVYEVATFYTMFNRSKMGKYHVMICGTTPCRLQGALRIQEAIEKHLDVHIGETTKDGMFTFSEMECMGACVNAPMIAVADYTGGVEKFSYTYYEDLTPEDVVSILDKLKRGEKPKPGSQHRDKAEPAGCVASDKAGLKWIPSKGLATLTSEPRGPYAPNLG